MAAVAIIEVLDTNGIVREVNALPGRGSRPASESLAVAIATDHVPLKTGYVMDSAGTWFHPASLAHAYTYDGSGNLETDTCVDGGVTRVKTFGYSSGLLQSETKWVVQ